MSLNCLPLRKHRLVVDDSASDLLKCPQSILLFNKIVNNTLVNNKYDAHSAFETSLHAAASIGGLYLAVSVLAKVYVYNAHDYLNSKGMIHPICEIAVAEPEYISDQAKLHWTSLSSKSSRNNDLHPQEQQLLATVDCKSSLIVTQFPSGSCIYREDLSTSLFNSLDRCCFSWNPDPLQNQSISFLNSCNDSIVLRKFHLSPSDSSEKSERRAICRQIKLDGKTIKSICHVHWVTGSQIILGIVESPSSTSSSCINVSLGVLVWPDLVDCEHSPIMSDSSGCEEFKRNSNFSGTLQLTANNLLYSKLSYQGSSLFDVFDTRSFFHLNRLVFFVLIRNTNLVRFYTSDFLPSSIGMQHIPQLQLKLVEEITSDSLISSIDCYKSTSTGLLELLALAKSGLVHRYQLHLTSIFPAKQPPSTNQRQSNGAVAIKEPAEIHIDSLSKASRTIVNSYLLKQSLRRESYKNSHRSFQIMSNAVEVSEANYSLLHDSMHPWIISMSHEMKHGYRKSSFQLVGLIESLEQCVYSSFNKSTHSHTRRFDSFLESKLFQIQRQVFNLQKSVSIISKDPTRDVDLLSEWFDHLTFKQIMSRKSVGKILKDDGVQEEALNKHAGYPATPAVDTSPAGPSPKPKEYSTSGNRLCLGDDDSDEDGGNRLHDRYTESLGIGGESRVYNRSSSRLTDVISVNAKTKEQCRRKASYWKGVASAIRRSNRLQSGNRQILSFDFIEHQIESKLRVDDEVKSLDLLSLQHPTPPILVDCHRQNSLSDFERIMDEGNATIEQLRLQKETRDIKEQEDFEAQAKLAATKKISAEATAVVAPAAATADTNNSAFPLANEMDPKRTRLGGNKGPVVEEKKVTFAALSESNKSEPIRFADPIIVDKIKTLQSQLQYEDIKLQKYLESHTDEQLLATLEKKWATKQEEMNSTSASITAPATGTTTAATIPADSPQPPVSQLQTSSSVPYTAAEIEKIVLAIYMDKNPDKIKDIPTLISKYGASIIERMENKFSVKASDYYKRSSSIDIVQNQPSSPGRSSFSSLQIPQTPGKLSLAAGTGLTASFGTPGGSLFRSSSGASLNKTSIFGGSNNALSTAGATNASSSPGTGQSLFGGSKPTGGGISLFGNSNNNIIVQPGISTSSSSLAAAAVPSSLFSSQPSSMAPQWGSGFGGAAASPSSPSPFGQPMATTANDDTMAAIKEHLNGLSEFEFEQLIIAIYRQYEQSKLPNVKSNIAKYVGRRMELLSAMMNKYDQTGAILEDLKKRSVSKFQSQQNKPSQLAGGPTMSMPSFLPNSSVPVKLSFPTNSVCSPSPTLLSTNSIAGSGALGMGIGFGKGMSSPSGGAMSMPGANKYLMGAAGSMLNSSTNLSTPPRSVFGSAAPSLFSNRKN